MYNAQRTYINCNVGASCALAARAGVRRRARCLTKKFMRHSGGSGLSDFWRHKRAAQPASVPADKRPRGNDVPVRPQQTDVAAAAPAEPTDPHERLHRAVAGKGLRLESYSGTSISSDVSKQVVALVQSNMDKFLGWDVMERMSDLTHPATRVLILRAEPESTMEASGSVTSAPPPLPLPSRLRSAHDGPHRTIGTCPTDGPIAGVASYRFVTQETLKVTYLFELQIDVRWRRQGLGAHLLDAVRDLGRSGNRQGMLLTVHLANSLAHSFYLSRGLTVSPISPSRCAPSEIASHAPHELMQCFWDADAAAIMEARGAAAMRSNYVRAGNPPINHERNTLT